jgi:hypothetical protein
VIDFQFLQAWLIETVWGILLLGAAGSVVGAVIIYLTKRLATKIIESKDVAMMRMLYPLGREVEIGEKIRGVLGPVNRDAQFLVYHTLQSLGCIFDTFALLLSLTLTAHLAIAYGIDRPVLLSVMIALNFIFFWGFLKSGLRLSSHVTQIVESTAKKIDDDQPKKFSAWYKARKKDQS